MFTEHFLLDNCVFNHLKSSIGNHHSDGLVIYALFI